MDYQSFVRRNWGLIPQNIQREIGKAKILLVGCGLGSQVAILAARTGFQEFIVADGDSVELSNLNRQAFREEDIGVNKAIALSRKIYEINPCAQVLVVPTFLKEEKEIELCVSRADFIVNMADPDDAMWRISEIVRAQSKTEIHPLNIGWLGYCLVVSPDSFSLEEVLGGKPQAMEFYLQLLNNTLGGIPQELIPLWEQFGDRILQGEPIPQLGITVSMTASLVVGTITKVLLGQKVPLAPKPILADPWGDV